MTRLPLRWCENKLDGIANEMQLTLLRSSFSPIVKEGMDCSAALFMADGVTLAQASAIPIHLATMIPALGAVLEAYPKNTMTDGDVYLLNDPYCGGTHLPDITLFLPGLCRWAGRCVQCDDRSSSRYGWHGARIDSHKCNGKSIRKDCGCRR